MVRTHNRNLPWICPLPECGDIIASGELPEHSAIAALIRHNAATHPELLVKRRNTDRQQDLPLFQQMPFVTGQPFRGLERPRYRSVPKSYPESVCQGCQAHFEERKHAKKHRKTCAEFQDLQRYRAAVENPEPRPALAPQSAAVESIPRNDIQPSADGCPAPVALTAVRTLTLEPDNPDLAATELDFVLLPPGNRHLEEYFLKSATQRGSQLYKKEVDHTRIQFVKSLGEAHYYVGRQGWRNGYAVCVFPWTDKVLLECPVKGNAIYVLSKEWPRLVERSKKNLLDRYPGHCERVRHVGDWPEEVKKILKARSYAADFVY